MPHVCKVLLVLTDPIEKFRCCGYEYPRDLHGPGLCVDLRIVDRKQHFHVPEIRTPEAFRYVQGFGVWVAAVIEPGLIVDPDGIYDERVAFPISPRRTRTSPDRGWRGEGQPSVKIWRKV